MASPSPALLRLSIASTHRILCSPATVRPFSSQASRCSQTTTKATSPTHISFHHRPSVPRTSTRCMHKTPSSERHRRQPLAHNKEPVPEQPPTTDFGRMDVLAAAPVPSTAVEVCHHDGFGLNSGVRIENGDGALLVGGEAFSWRPWSVDEKGGKRLVNEKGQWEVGEEAWGVLGALWPRPDLLILGLGPEIRPLSPATRRAISNLGMRVEVLDTRNAASQYNMLATERGMGDVAAALIPIGWKEGRGAV